MEKNERPITCPVSFCINLRTVIEIDLLIFCLQKGDTVDGLIYPIFGFGKNN